MPADSGTGTGQKSHTLPGQKVEAVFAAASDPKLLQHRQELSSASELVAIHPRW
jgi:hypothetical protein